MVLPRYPSTDPIPLGHPQADTAFLLQRFAKAKALADLLLFKRSLSLNYSSTDPRYGIPRGGSEAGSFFVAGVFRPEMVEETPPLHYYASAAELYRACTEMGAVWSVLGSWVVVWRL